MMSSKHCLVQLFVKGDQRKRFNPKTSHPLSLNGLYLKLGNNLTIFVTEIVVTCGLDPLIYTPAVISKEQPSLLSHSRYLIPDINGHCSLLDVATYSPISKLIVK